MFRTKAKGDFSGTSKSDLWCLVNANGRGWIYESELIGCKFMSWTLKSFMNRAEWHQIGCEINQITNWNCHWVTRKSSAGDEFRFRFLICSKAGGIFPNTLRHKILLSDNEKTFTLLLFSMTSFGKAKKLSGTVPVMRHVIFSAKQSDVKRRSTLPSLSEEKKVSENNQRRKFYKTK